MMYEDRMTIQALLNEYRALKGIMRKDREDISEDMRELRNHFYAKAREMNINVKHGFKFSSAIYDPNITIESMDTENNYASGMHELGHQALRYTTVAVKREALQDKNCCPDHILQYQFYMLSAELEAWAWAKKNAIRWTEQMENEYKLAYSSYIKGALHEATRHIGMTEIQFFSKLKEFRVK